MNFKRANATPDSTPLDSKPVLYKEKCSKENRKDQQTESLIGSIMYLREVLANVASEKTDPTLVGDEKRSTTSHASGKRQ